MLVHTLGSLTGMEKHETQSILEAARIGNKEAQERIKVALDTDYVVVDGLESSADTNPPSLEGSTEEAEMGQRGAGVQLLRLLAEGELERFEEARQEMCEAKAALRAKTGCHGKGKGKGKGHWYGWY